MQRAAGLFNQFVIFSGVGIIGTAFHFLSLIVLVALSAPALLASSTGAVIGALINYLLNRRFTFRSGVAHRQALPRYLAIAAIGWAINGVVFASLMNNSLHYLVAQMGATAVVLVWGFFLNRFWTFSGERSYGK